MKRLASIVLLLVVAPPAAMAGTKEVKAWDQAAVTALGVELAKNVEAVYDGAYKDPTGGDLLWFVGQPHHEFMDRLRLLRGEAIHYRSLLKKGGGRDATLPVVKRMNELHDDIIENSLQIHLDKPTPERLAALKKLIIEINAYYGYRAPWPDHSGFRQSLRGGA